MEPLGQEKSEERTKSDINAQASRKPILPIALDQHQVARRVILSAAI